MNELTTATSHRVLIRGGIEIPLDETRVQRLKELLISGQTQFFECDGEIINRADVVGVFSTDTMERLRVKRNPTLEEKTIKT